MKVTVMSPSPTNSLCPGAGNLGQGSGQCEIIGIVTRHSQQSEPSEHKYYQRIKYAGCSARQARQPWSAVSTAQSGGQAPTDY